MKHLKTFEKERAQAIKDKTRWYMNQAEFSRYHEALKPDFRWLSLEGWTYKELESLANCDFTSANLANCCFVDCLFMHSDFSQADLSAASFTGCMMDYAVFQEADLSDCSFEQCDLESIMLQGADISDTTFNNCELEYVNFENVNISNLTIINCDLHKAKRILQIGPVGSRCDMLTAVYHEDTLMVKTGCFWGNLATFQERVAEKGAESHARIQYEKIVIPALKAWYRIERKGGKW